MNIASSDLLFYAVTDRRWTGRQTLTQQVEAALRGGITLLQYREKTLPPEDCLNEISELMTLCHRYAVPFIVNDNPTLALATGADGVHLGQSDGSIAQARELLGSAAIIGVSVHTVASGLAAEREGADYLGTGAIFGSSTKTDACAVSLETVARLCASVTIPVVAIGGIDETNADQLAGLGLAGAALISAVFAAPEIEKRCHRLKDILRHTFESTQRGLNHERT